MLRVAICDDNKEISVEIKAIIETYMREKQCKITVDFFYKGEDLISFIIQEHTFDLIFLDIELVTTTGVEVGKKIRKELDDYQSKIVFISAKTGYERALFDLQPFNFLSKPLDKEKVWACMELAQRLLDKEIGVFRYKIKSEIKKVVVADILYFESKYKKVKIVTKQGEDYFYDSLAKIKKELPTTFIEPHGSFFVNNKYVQRITNKEIWLVTGESIPISRRYLKRVQMQQLDLVKGRR